MGPRRAIQTDDLRMKLAHAVGIADYPSNTSAEPYLNYITNRYIGKGTREEYLKLFIRVVKYFTRDEKSLGRKPRLDSIQALLEHLISSDEEDVFVDTKPGSGIRQGDVEDTVLYIVGVWTMMLGSFLRITNRLDVSPAERRGFEDTLAEYIRKRDLLPTQGSWRNPPTLPLEEDAVQLARRLIAVLSGQGAASSPARSSSPLNSPTIEMFEAKMDRRRIACHSVDDMDFLESLSVKATRLNAYTLSVLGAVELYWTHDISRHMLLSHLRGRYRIELFALPCAFQATTLTSDAVGISSELAQEIQESYSILFNAWPEQPLHAKLGFFLGVREFCFCWSCSAYRFRARTIKGVRSESSTSSPKARARRQTGAESEFDPLLIELMNGNEPSDWTYDLFPHLWQRITLLEAHLQRAKPWSIWILFRDRRDTLQFWTFFFATIVVLMTFLQVALGVAQVVGSFQ